MDEIQPHYSLLELRQTVLVTILLRSWETFKFSGEMKVEGWSERDMLGWITMGRYPRIVLISPLRPDSGYVMFCCSLVNYA